MDLLGHFGIDFSVFSIFSESAKTGDFGDGYTVLHENTIPKPIILSSIFHQIFMFFPNPPPDAIFLEGQRANLYPKVRVWSNFWLQGSQNDGKCRRSSVRYREDFNTFSTSQNTKFPLGLLAFSTS